MFAQDDEPDFEVGWDASPGPDGHYIHPWRQVVDHERYEDETFVAINGPEVVHCDPLVKESMEEYWRQFLRAGDRGGHFVRRRNDVKNWTVSKAVDALAKEPPRLSFMAK